MLSLYAVTILALMAGTTTASPAPIGAPALVKRTPTPVQLTNSQRLSQGLALNPPQPRSNERRHGPSAGAHGVRPTEVGPAGSFPTGSPEQWSNEGEVEGHISCIEPDGHVIKIASKPNDQGLFAHTEDDDDELEVKIDLGAASRGPVNIEFIHSWWKVWTHFTSQDFIGAIAGPDEASSVLGPSRHNFARLGGAEKTEAGKGPTIVANSISDVADSTYFGLTPIWRYQVWDGTLKAQWHNLDGSSPDVTVFYDPQSGGFGLTGDIAAYKQAYNREARECRLSFSPL